MMETIVALFGMGIVVVVMFAYYKILSLGFKADEIIWEAQDNYFKALAKEQQKVTRI